MSKKSQYELTCQSDLEKLRDSILNQFTKRYKIVAVHPSKESNLNDDEKEIIKKKHSKRESYSMYDDVSEMQKSMKIPANLEQELIRMEKRLISKSAKQHISRRCCHGKCEKMAPESYPNNVYLCDTHKKRLYRKLEKYDIPLNKGTYEEREKCKKLKEHHQNIINALKVPDSQQTFGNNQHKYPPNYFTVCMSKLLLCQQELSNPYALPLNANDELRNSHGKMKDVVKKLMDLLIAGRQNLNDHWECIMALITVLCNDIHSAPSWLEANTNFITIILAFIEFIADLLRIIFPDWIDEDAEFVAGAVAVGTGVGATAGIYAAVESGAAVGTVLGGPLFGAVVGGLIGGGLAIMYQNG